MYAAEGSEEAGNEKRTVDRRIFSPRNGFGLVEKHNYKIQYPSDAQVQPFLSNSGK